MINGICRIVEHYTMLAVHHLLHGVDSLVNHTLVESDASHSTPSLTLDKDLTLLILIRANLIGIKVGNAIFGGILTTGVKSAAELCILLTRNDKEAGNHERLSLRALTVVLSSLETLVGIPRETVEIETVVPVGTTDERKCVRTKIVGDMLH